MRLRKRSIAVCALVVGLLSGCNSTAKVQPDPLADVPKQVGAPVQVVARLPGPYGQQVLFTFQKGDTCGFGQAYRSPDGKSAGSGFTSHECVFKLGPPAFEVMGAGLWLPDGAKAAFPELDYGPVHDARIVRMTVTLPDGRELPGTVKDGFWYIQLPTGSGRPTTITAWDQAGGIVDTNVPVTGP